MNIESSSYLEAKMKILYIEPSYGISGDMTVAAFLDLGVPFEHLKAELDKLKMDDFSLKTSGVMKSGIGAAFFEVIVEKEQDGHHHRHLSNIIEIIDKSGLSENVKQSSREMFHALAEVEAAVHGKTIEEVHFHEVGAVDSIVDIIGVCICIDYLKPEKIISSKVNLGSGYVNTAHGKLPVPPPAVSALVQGMPVFTDDSGVELTTPTGALVLKTFADEFGPMPVMNISATGYGAGSRDLPGKPNILRIFSGETEAGDGIDISRVNQLETQVDDMTGEALGYLREVLSAAGALDVVYIPAQMKKDRPATLIKIVVKDDNTQEVLRALFDNSSTLGVRVAEQTRYELKREFVKVNTSFGQIQMKVSKRPGGKLAASPEYEDCRAAALKHGVSLLEVQQEALKKYNEQESE